MCTLRTPTHPPALQEPGLRDVWKGKVLRHADTEAGPIEKGVDLRRREQNLLHHLDHPRFPATRRERYQGLRAASGCVKAVLQQQREVFMADHFVLRPERRVTKLVVEIKHEVSS